MIVLFTDEEFNNAKSRSLLPLQCKQCGSLFYKTKNEIQKFNKNPVSKIRTHDFCSRQCCNKSRDISIDTTCESCQIDIKVPNRVFNKSKTCRFYCSKSCAAKYNNTHKTIGTRRSKLELQIEQQLIQLYPNLEINFNKKDAIESELDIYIPSLKLAFELNGIFHYEPIYGDEKLQSIQNNDTNKFMKCQQKQISLCIIDTSKQSYFKEQTAKPFLKIITSIIDQSLACI